MSDLYSVATFEIVHSFRLNISKLLYSSLAHYLISNEIHSYAGSPSVKQNRLESVWLWLLKARSSVVAHLGAKHPVLGLYVYFSKKKRAAQLSSLFTEKRMREVLMRRSCYAGEKAFLFLATSFFKRTGSVQKSGLTWMSIFCTQIVSKMLSDFKDSARVSCEVVRLRSETLELK